jgi:hypothetical protein
VLLIMSDQTVDDNRRIISGDPGKGSFELNVCRSGLLLARDERCF